MKTFILFLSFLFLVMAANSQALLSRFTWESAPVTKAVNGPDAISVSNAATSSTDGVAGTKGLNPGAGSVNIDLVLPGSYFNVPAIDISVDFRREENQASFFYRGNNLNFGMNGGNLELNFMYTKSDNNSVNVGSGSIYNIPDDHSFHNYRFVYDNNAGIAKVYVDGTVVYTFTGVAGAPLYWTGAGNITIGKDMDATGRNVAILDNLIIQNPSANAALPLSLLSFTAEARNNISAINWSTSREFSVAGFQLEKSFDGVHFIAIKNIPATNNYYNTNNYKTTDSMPSATTVYYRLKMMDIDGKFSYSPVVAVSFGGSIVKAQLRCYPNPTTDYIKIQIANNTAGEYSYSLVSLSGQVFMANTVALQQGVQEINIDLTKTTAKGIMLVQLTNKQSNTIETYKIVRN